MLPPPTLTFTIPSIEDDVVIQCRVYHPTCLVPTSISQISGWRKRAAIVAHPYAPLGGSYDDPIVDIVAATILKQGFVVGTFNFRGAGTSKERTSWQSRAEQNDHISFIAFMICYIHHLKPPALPVGFPKPSSPVPSHALPEPHPREPLSPSFNRSVSTNIPAFNVEEGGHPQARLRIAGYSYGALIAAHLPPIISSLISPFQNPLPGSPHAEI
ncbi:hypothetical protein B0O99DRAFT_700497 [Bisporella sp. PMI_857]|nr:hypothetical protein B0O99DRAFT_700497 [Bisporella sp. PMI_857]